MNCLFCKKIFWGRKEQKFCSFRCSVEIRKGKLPKNINQIAGWNKDKKGVSKETQLKMRLAKLNKIGNRLGIKASKETIIKLQKSHLGQIPWNKEIKVPQITGKNHPRWKGIKYKRCIHTTNTLEYRNWRNSIFQRDNYKCKINNQCKGQLQAHHILNWTDYSELRYEINNGITLCQVHHPRKRAEEKRLSPYFQDLVSVPKVLLLQ